jgi:hypothetical protein
MKLEDVRKAAHAAGLHTHVWPFGQEPIDGPATLGVYREGKFVGSLTVDGDVVEQAAPWEFAERWRYEKIIEALLAGD